MSTTVNKIRVRNEILWEHALRGDNIDDWLRSEVGLGNWTEWFGITNLPYRSFSFKDQKHEAMFILRWC